MALPSSEASSTASLASPRAGRLCWGVFLVLSAVYLLTANGHVLGQDQEYYYRMSRALVLERSFAIEPLGASNEAGSLGADGRFYAQYPPALPLALAPLVALGRLLEDPAADLRDAS